MKRPVAFFSAVVILLGMVACASSGDADLEAARFALDSGDYDTAVTKAGAALTADPADVDAALVLSSAYSGKAGILLLDVTADLSEESNTDNEFDAIHDSLFGDINATTGLDDLRSAIVTLNETLTPQPDATNERYTDLQFQAGLLAAVEAFGLPSLTAQPTADGAIDASLITSKDAVEDDFINADDNFIESGLDATDTLITNIRENYCVLRSLSGAAEGFDLDVLQDLTWCQLDPTGAAPTSVASCAAFTTKFATCSGADDSELDSTKL